MSDENQGQDQNGNEDDKAQKKAALRRMQYDLLIMDADLKKIISKKEQLMMEIKRLKRQADLLKVQIGDKEKEQKKMESEELLAKNEFLALKKKINLMN